MQDNQYNRFVYDKVKSSQVNIIMNELLLIIMYLDDHVEMSDRDLYMGENSEMVIHVWKYSV